MIASPYVQEVLDILDLEQVPAGGAQRSRGTWRGFLVSGIESRYPDPTLAASALLRRVPEAIFVSWCAAGNILELGL